MDEGQNFCLQWNSYQTSVTSLFNDLRRDGELVDVTLCAQGQQIKVHRMMLSACSPYFRDVLKGNLGTHPVFFMRDISFKDLTNIVEFMYRGKVNVAQSELGSFLKTAETLQVRGLTGDEDPAPEPPRKSRPSTNSAPAPPPPRLSPEPQRHRPAPAHPQHAPPPPPPLAAAPPNKRPLTPPPPSGGDHALLTPKRPRSVDHGHASPAAVPEASLPRPGSEPVSVKEEPLVLEDGDSDSYGGHGAGVGENSSSSSVMPLLGDADQQHLGFLSGTPTHSQAHEFQDEDLLAAVAGPSGFPQDHSDSSTPELDALELVPDERLPRKIDYLIRHNEALLTLRDGPSGADPEDPLPLKIDRLIQQNETLLRNVMQPRVKPKRVPIPYPPPPRPPPPPPTTATKPAVAAVYDQRMELDKGPATTRAVFHQFNQRLIADERFAQNVTAALSFIRQGTPGERVRRMLARVATRQVLSDFTFRGTAGVVGAPGKRSFSATPLCRVIVDAAGDVSRRVIHSEISDALLEAAAEPRDD